MSYQTMTYDELPEVIQSICPRNKVAHCYKLNEDTIIVQVTYDKIKDVWKLENGQWVFHNPPRS